MGLEFKSIQTKFIGWTFAVMVFIICFYTVIIQYAIPDTPIRIRFLMLGIVILILCLASIIFFSKTFLEPIIKISRAMIRLSKGKPVRKICTKRKDEVGELAEAFNRLVEMKRKRKK